MKLDNFAKSWFKSQSLKAQAQFLVERVELINQEKTAQKDLRKKRLYRMAEEMESIIYFNQVEYFAWENLYKENKKC